MYQIPTCRTGVVDCHVLKVAAACAVALLLMVSSQITSVQANGTIILQPTLTGQIQMHLTHLNQSAMVTR